MSDRPVYKSGTSKEDIIYDGWSRDFEVSQTVSELKAQGFVVNEREVHSAFDKHQKVFEAHLIIVHGIV